MLNTITLLLAIAPQSFEWNEKAQLTASDASIDDEFGRSVAVDGDTLVVGAPFDDAGAAYVFQRAGTTWVEQTKLVASDPETGDRFGWSVAILGDTALVGAPREDDPGLESGAAYVFRRSGTVWSEEAKLEADDPSFGDRFGRSVALSGDTALIGARAVDTFGVNSGAAYVFLRSGTSWSQQAKLEASDGVGGARFGSSVSIDGDTALIGAFRDLGFTTFTWAGSAYVFQRTGTIWSQQDKLKASDTAPFDEFGTSVAIHGNTALVGAPLDDNSGGAGAGSAYLFRRSSTTWSETAKIVASDAASLDYFGRSVALHGGTAVVGAYLNDELGINAGGAYAFRRTGTSWAEEAKLTNVAGTAHDWFGWAVAVSGETVVVGAPFDDMAFENAGTAFVHEATLLSVGEIYCSAGTSASGCQALINGSGTPSATATSGFVLAAIHVEGAKDGLFFYGTNGRQANPWYNGTSYVCVVPPRLRGGLLTAVGSTVGLCDGTLAQDLNARWCPTCPNPSHNPGAGAVMQAQLWYRDPQNTSSGTSSMSDAVEFTVGP